MHSLFGKRGLVLAGLVAVALGAMTPSVASAKPEPGAKPRGFRLFARSLGALTVNRIYCGLGSAGEVCVDSTNSSTIGGGFWPKGTADQYVFNSGLQIAGKIGADGGPWAGHTTGAFFFDPKGTTQHGEEVRPIYNTQNPADAAFIGDSLATDPTAIAARVPVGDSTQFLFSDLLRGRTSASQGDVWWMSWDGNPTLAAGRPHPLGVLVETRGMGWNYPTGNQDIAYFIYTFYNITSTDPAAYANVRPGVREILIEKAKEFKQKNEAAFNIQLPAGGYTIESAYAAFGADNDVANSGSNWSSVNLPFALGYTYDAPFTGATGWTFDPGIFGGAFFPGSGFIGVKYLKSPTGPGAIQLYSNTINSATGFRDPQNVGQLYRYLSGTVSAGAGDQPCNIPGNVAQTHVCFINPVAADSRFFQSSTALTLKPGEFKSIVVAYIFAAPVKIGSYTPGPQLAPGDPLATNTMSKLTTPGAVNQIDSLTGYAGFADANGDGIPQQGEFKFVPGSLLGKALVAQAVFDAGFLLPFAPDVPEFFLVPGDNQVTVLWRPSASETLGDPFFAIANAPTRLNPVTNAIEANPLYDPNYRKFDVEGYRIYRGRVDSPNQMELVAQFDYAGTSLTDFRGFIQPTANCAPELSVPALPNKNCPFPALTPGVAVDSTTGVSIPLVGDIVQVKVGSRAALAGTVTDTVIARIDTTFDTVATTPAVVVDTVVNPGDTTFAIHTHSTAVTILPGQADTATTGGGKNGVCAPSACLPLKDTGVPFVYVDKNVRNNFRYFYSVTAFDINSFASGPSSIESPRITKPATPVPLGTNFNNAVTINQVVVSRSGAPITTPMPTLDPTTGIFSGKMPPADGLQLGFGQLVSQVVTGSGALAARLDSLQMGQVDLSGCCGGGFPGIPANYFFTVTANGTTTQIVVPVQQDLEADETGQGFFDALNVNDALAKQFGGNGNFVLKGSLAHKIPAVGWTGSFLGIALGAAGFDENPAGTTGGRYNGFRWFSGANESTADPTAAGTCGTGIGACAVSATSPAGLANAGSLPGVTNVYMPRSYTVINREWRNVEAALGSARRAADFNVYWGDAGKIDSVVDVTHDVVVPFRADQMQGTWGILNQAASAVAGSFDGQPHLSPTDFTCVEPFRSILTEPGGAFFPCASAAPVALSNTAVLGPVSFGFGSNQSATGRLSVKNPANTQPNPGFGLYLAGTISLFELPSLPAKGTVWTLRTYTGWVWGGKGGAPGNLGPYKFVSAPRPFTAVGATTQLQFSVANTVVAATKADLEKVHTVPDPYYVTNQFEQATESKILKFVNLPQQAIIRIYSSSGVLVSMIEHNSAQNGGAETWNLRNRNNQVVASGVYFYHIESGDARRVGRFTVVNFAQ